MDLTGLFVLAVTCLVSLVPQSYATAQNNLSLCFTCNSERCQDLKKIFNSMTDDKLWMQSTAMSAPLDCSLSSYPSSGKCVPCVEYRKVYIVCTDMLKDIKLDLEDGKSNYLTNSEATCPRLKLSGPAGHKNPNAPTSIPNGTGGLYKGANITVVMSAAAVLIFA